MVVARCTQQVFALEVAISCTVNCRASAIIYRVLEFMAIINWTVILLLSYVLQRNAQALVNIPAIFNRSLCFAAAWIFSKCCFCSKLQKRLSHNWEKETSFLYSSSQTITPFDRDSISFCFVQWWKYLGWIRSLAFFSCPSSSIPTITNWFTHDSSFRAIDAHSVR